jgi:hypothetical protein
MRARTRTRSLLVFALLVFAPLVAGCDGIPTSSEPYYPADWPAIVRANDDVEQVDISGTYRVLSEQGAPLIYPSDGQVQSSIALIPLGDPEQPPRVGRRALPWYFIGFINNQTAIEKLGYFLTKLRPNAQHPDGHEDVGWVRISRKSKDEGYTVEVGIGDEPQFEYQFTPRPPEGSGPRYIGFTPGYWPFDGGLRCLGPVRVSMDESPNGWPGYASVTATMYRAVDGSLIVLEDPFRATIGGEVNFQKWWRWKPVLIPDAQTGAAK